MISANTVALQSLDLGSVYSPDGREHPITGLTPINPLSLSDLLSFASTQSSADSDPGQQSATGNAIGQFKNGMKLGEIFGSWLTGGSGPDSTLSRNAVIRLVIILIAILLLVVGVFRITSSN